MGEGFGQFVFILILLAAAAFDAMGRNKAKKRRMEEMEREEGEGGTATAERPRPSDRYSRAPDAQSQGQEAAGERQTADAMIPDDFWAILTGQAPVQVEEEAGPATAESGRRDEERRQQESRAAERSTREGTGADEWRGPGSSDEGYRPRRSTQDPPLRPNIPTPVPMDRYSREPTPSARGEERDPDAPTRRGGRWMEGLERPSPADEDAIRAQESAVYGSLGDPWGELEDISTGQIDDDGALVGGIGDDEDAPARRRRPRGSSPYTEFLESGNREDLKKAIVLKEVLGTPAGFREIGHGWGMER
jgi:hypothetical protein